MKPTPRLVPGHNYDQHPQFIVFGGLVLMALSIPYLSEFGKEWHTQAPKGLVDLTNKPMLFASQQAVVLAQVLPDDTTVGYNMIDVTLHKIDGICIKNTQHVQQVLYRSIVKGM